MSVRLPVKPRVRYDEGTGKYVLQTRSIENPAVPLTSAAVLAYFGLDQPSMTGVHVTESTAMNFATVATCVRILSQSIAALPLQLMRRKSARSSEQAKDHPIYALLARRPNEAQSSVVWREVQMGHVLLWGNWYTRIEFGRRGRAERLVPLLPDRTQPKNLRGRITYESLFSDDTGAQRDLRLDQDEVLHIPGLSFDGVRGYAPITLMRETIAQGVLARDFASRTFATGGLRGWIEHPGQFKDEAAAQEFRRLWEQTYSGVQNAGKVAVLQKGLKYHGIDSMPLQDAELLAARKFTAREIAGWFGVPPYMLGDMEQAKFTNMEQGDLYFVKHVVTPWLTKIEQELDRKLLLDSERDEFFFKFNVDGLLRGDSKSRTEQMQALVTTGIWSINDAREKLDMPADDPALDEHRVPLNTVEAGKEPPKQQAPADEEEEDRLAPFEILVRDACERIARKECKALSRMAAKGDGEAFVAEVAEFLADHGAYVRAQLGAVFAAMTAVAGVRYRVEDAARRHVGAVRDELAEALNDGGLEAGQRWIEAHAESAAATLTEQIMQAWRSTK